MVQLHRALSLVLASTATSLDAFHIQSHSSLFSFRSTLSQKQFSYSTRSSITTRPVASATPSASEFDDGQINNHNQNKIDRNLNSLTNAAAEFVGSLDEPDLDAPEIARRRELLQNRKGQKTYKVTLPLLSPSASLSTPSSADLKMGISLCQVSKGRKIDAGVQLNLDTLELEKRRSSIANRENSEIVDLVSLVQRRIDGEFHGLVVSSVEEGSAGWMAGVRPGDLLRTTSATLGSQLWPKSTLEGVKSALLSRKAVSESVQFEFQRLGEIVDNQFELTLTRPIGLELKETEDGYVEVTGFTEKASTLVRYAVKLGDRVLAIDSSLGERMWPVSTVEGVVSAVTSRLPGSRITFRFERNPSSMESNSKQKEVSISKTIQGSTAAVSPTIDTDLQKRCREIMNRYTTDQKYVNKFALSGVVADKVTNALASAGTRIDPYTLSMILTAYLSCRQPEKAAQLFEEAIGLRADGTSGKVTVTQASFEQTDDENPFIGKNGNRLIPNIEALDVYTVSAVLKAQAMKGDLSAVKRVLAALEGQAGIVIDGAEVALWPGTGAKGNLKPNNRCYNIVMSAAADTGTEEGLTLALDLFNKLSDPRKASRRLEMASGALEKDAVSFNTIIKALTNNERFEEAIDVFYQMKRSGIKPDKFSYTSLVKAIVAQDGIEEFLYDMRDQGVVPDTMTFNNIIRCLCEQRKMSKAKKIVSMMEESGVAPDSWTYGYLMTGLITNDNASAALTLFETACSDSRTVHITQNVYLYTTAMTAAATIGDHSRALELLARMKVLGIKPNLKTLTTLIGACLSAKKADLAIDIYQRIPKPDSYAVTQGLIAYAEAGQVNKSLALLADRRSIAGKLRGKQLNRVYDVMLKNCVSTGDYDTARRVVKSLLGRGNILSKALLQSVFECMGLLVTKGLVSRVSFSEDGLVTRGEMNQTDEEKFKFLLFLIDSVLNRNLPCEASLYSISLSFGSHLGGLPKKVAALMVASKTTAALYESENRLIDDSVSETTNAMTGWEHLFVSYDELRTQLKSLESLPRLRVRIAAREVLRVLKAEKTCYYKKRFEV